MVEGPQYREIYSKTIRFFFTKRRPGALFVALCIILLMATAVSMTLDQKALSDRLAVIAFFFLVVGVGLEIVNLRYSQLYSS